MSYERQRDAALRMVKKYGVSGMRERTVSTPDPTSPWKSTTAVDSVAVHLVSFADDGVTFVNHNIQGNVRLLTIVSNQPLDLQVGDTIRTAKGVMSVKAAKALDPDLEGAILWAALVQ